MSGFERHVFVCLNQRSADDPRGACLARGGVAVFDRLKVGAHEAGLKGRVRVNRAGCLDHCASGCAVVVYPEGVWYGRVTPEDADEIVREHLVGGRPVERLRQD